MVKSLYEENGSIDEVDGDQALQDLTKGENEKLAHDNRPVLIQFYHPELENAK